MVAARARGLPVVGDIELFAQAREEWPQAKVIAITGSNGKSTVTEMVGAMSVPPVGTLVAGNIGLPILDACLEVKRESAQTRCVRARVVELSIGIHP